jgi:hypothetical protein
MQCLCQVLWVSALTFLKSLQMPVCYKNMSCSRSIFGRKGRFSRSTST